jgi:hypothetical protein
MNDNKDCVCGNVLSTKRMRKDGICDDCLSLRLTIGTTNELTLVDLDDILLRSAVASAIHVHVKSVIGCLHAVTTFPDNSHSISSNINEGNKDLVKAIFNIIALKGRGV